ncbi:hypothetical protein TNCV_3443441 [Trichonephila clavipes]|nr:hypothetical protein TNCV_3443441 [Trichonephila clavipes]
MTPKNAGNSQKTSHIMMNLWVHCLLPGVGTASPFFGGEKTTQLSSRNEQLNSATGTKQLNYALPSSACNCLKPPTTACNHLQPPTTACKRLQSPKTAYNHLQPPTTACNRLDPPATACTAFTAESAFSTYCRKYLITVNYN